MYNFIRIQFLLGKITEEQVKKYVPAWLNSEQAEKIIKEKEVNA